MNRPLILGVALTFVAGAASAQCLSLADGSGNVTVSCPDGRTGYLHADGAGLAAGMVGTQPFSALAPSYAPFGTPGVGQVDVPPPPGFSLPPPPPMTAPMPSFSASPPEGLSALQRQYLAEGAARRAREAAGKP